MSRDWALRAARPTDAGAVGAILGAFATETEWMPRLHTKAEDIAHAGQLIDRGWVTVATQDGKVTGFLARDATEIHALYVQAKARGQGVGTALIRHAQALVDTLSLWTFQANTAAQRFYLWHGFAEVARTDGAGNDEGLPDLRLTWTAPAKGG